MKCRARRKRKKFVANCGGRDSAITREENILEIRSEVHMQASESGNWKSFSGGIVSACISGVLVQAFNVLIGLSKP